MGTHNTLEQNNFISKETTNIIKGVALIFMFIHHFFTFPSWYVDGISYPYLEDFARLFCQPFRICVHIFAFLTGYFYFFAKNKNYLYSIKKCTDLWVDYFFTFLVLLMPAVLLNTYNFSITDFLLESVALYRPTMKFCWYVVFYIVAMLILPLYSKISEKSTVLSFFMTSVVFLVAFISHFTYKIIPKDLLILSEIVYVLKWLPCVALGYFFAQNNLFFIISKKIKTKHTFVNVLISICLMLIPFLFGRYATAFCLVYVPLFIYGLVSITDLIKNKKILFPLSIIGKYSLSMWFVHCAFFNSYKEYTQWILYLPKNPILVLLWGLLICLIISYIIMIPINIIIKLKNRLFKW